jgi:anti-repressor protein
MDTNQITRFDFHGANVRVLTDEQGEPWFVGKDVAKVLGYSDANKAVAMHVDHEDRLNNESLSSLGQRGDFCVYGGAP